VKLIWPLLAMCLSAGTSMPATACSIPMREHPNLASSEAALTQDASVTIRLVINEVLIAARFANADRIHDVHQWFAVRGMALASNEDSAIGRTIEVEGPFRATCFYPSEAYERDSAEKLIVWLNGEWNAEEAALQISHPSRSTADVDEWSAAERGSLVWAQIRFPSPE
jgi:hypothetical protein